MLDEATPTEDPIGDSSEVYLPGQPLQDGEELVHDSTAYHMYHAVRTWYHNVCMYLLQLFLSQAQTGAPCLSFDIIRDKLGDNRTNYPMTAYLVAGTQVLTIVTTVKLRALN